MASFTVPCPSCEAKVLIKNPKLAGTKVECPKCKYRFVAEAPKEAAEPDAAKPAKDDSKEKKTKDKEKGKAKEKAAAGDKKGGGKKNNKKMVGVVLGVGAVLLLVVGAVVLFGGGDDKSGGGGGGGGGSGFAGGGGSPTYTEGEGSNPDENPDGKKPEPKKVSRIPRSDKDPTNLLPGNSVAVYRLDVGNLRLSPLGGPLFDQSMSDLFRTSMGLEPSAVDQYYHCMVGDKERAPFGLIRLKEPTLDKDILPHVAGLAKNPQSVNDRALYSIKNNPFLSAVGSAFALRSLLSDVYEKVPAAVKNTEEKPLGFCVYDTQTLLLGDLTVLKNFLGSLKDGYPPFQTVYRKAAPPPPPMPKDPMMDPMMDPMAAPEGTEGQPMPKPKVEPKPEPLLNKDFTTNPTYLSVSSELKRLLNVMDEEPGGPPIFILAEKFDSALYDRKGIKPSYGPIVKVIDPVLSRLGYIGVNLSQFQTREVRATIHLVGKTGDDARAIALEHLGPGLLQAVPVLSLMLSNPPFVYTPIQFRNYADPRKSYPMFGGNSGEFPGGEFPGSAYPMGGFPMGGFPMGRFPMPGGEVGSPDGGAGPGPGPSGLNYGPPGRGGIPGMPGAIPGPGGGGFGAFFPQPGMSFPQPGMPGEGPMPGMEGQFPGQPMQPMQQPVDPSHIDLRLIDQTVTITLDLKWDDEIYGQVVAPRLVGFLNQIRGKAAVFAGNHTWHNLAQAVKHYVEQNKKFPSGTMPRPADDQNRVGLPYPPITRLSFFVELLPHLGRGGVTQGVNPRLAWFDDKNVSATESWVPELLVSYYPQTSWRAHSPLAPEHTFGGTNYVAIAGVGNDAARFDPARNPDKANVVGISGYDWGSKVEEVTDGLENTIYLMQVPPGFSRPWAAGGGATVVGLNPDNPMGSFKHKRPDGKEGTYAIMGDGSVRWIPADIDPKILLAMATRAGGEKLDDLDKVAPRVDPPGARNLVKTEAVVKPEGVPVEQPTATVQSNGPVGIAPAPREK